MKRFLWTTFAALGLVGGLAGPARAQWGYQRPYVNPRPTFNPILNLNRGGNPLVNYLGVVRPQMQMGQALQQQQLQLQQLQFGAPGGVPQGLVGSEAVNVMPSTGHPVSFMDYTRYFPLQGFRTGIGGAPGQQGLGGPPLGGTPTGVVRR